MISGRLDRRRLALVTDRFASDHVGERVAALEAAGRILAAGGASWRDIIDAAGDDRQSFKANDADYGDADQAPHHRVASALLKRTDELTRWERTFLSDLLAFRKLSEKQQRALDGIRHKVAARAARRWS